MNNLKKSLRFIVIEVAGFGLLILAPFLGSLPGPGGIPLVLAGLGLLSINHEWAKRLRERIMKTGGTFAKKIFPEHATVQVAYDLLTLLLLASVVSIFAFGEDRLAFLAGTLMSTATLLIFGMNRGRFDRFDTWLKQRISRNK